MRILINFFAEICLCAALLCCITCDRKNDSAKQSAEEVNRKVFSDKESRVDAQFIVDAVDQCYALLETAELGRTKGVSAQVKDQSVKIIEGQQFLLQEFQNYAAAASVSTPLDGPEKTSGDVRRLHKIKTEKFDEAWQKQMLDQTRKLIHDLEHHELFNTSRKTALPVDESLEPLLEGTLVTLRAHEELLTNYPATEQANNN